MTDKTLSYAESNLERVMALPDNTPNLSAIIAHWKLSSKKSAIT